MTTVGSYFGQDPASSGDLSPESSGEEDVEDNDSDLSDSRGELKRGQTEMREQMYQDKLADFKRQLEQLHEGTLPEYMKKLRKLEQQCKERRRVNAFVRELEVEMVEQDFINEKKAAVREFEEHKVYLRDQLIAELEERQKIVETESHNMELTGDSMELKTISTRKLRRRANEPNSSCGYRHGEKRRKAMQMMSVTYLLKDCDIMEDIKIINKSKSFSSRPKTIFSSDNTASSSSGGGPSSPSNSDYHFNIRVEDGKLFYQKRWFRRGQAILVEPRNGDKFPAMISAIGSDVLWVRKTSDSSKVRIYISQLSKGKFTIKRRVS